MIRLHVPCIEQEDLEAVSAVMSTGRLVQGLTVAALECKIAECANTRFAVAVSNCTAALHLALLALDVRPGDIVVVASYSWISTANVIELCGAHPVFTDISPDTFNMCPDSLERTLRRLMVTGSVARRVKAVIPVHTFGLMADMPRIHDICTGYGIPVVEDAACALGAAIGDRVAGAWGKVACFSFHPRKAVTTGEGGVLVTDDEEVAWKVRALRNHGLDPRAETPDFVMPGFNYRMTEFQAALGLSQLRKLERIHLARRKAAECYDRLLRSTEVVHQMAPVGFRHAHQSYVALLPEDASVHRDQLIEGLRKAGVETTIGTWHMPLTSYFRNRYGYRPGDLPIADSVFARALSLPLHEGLSASEQDFITTRLCEELLVPTFAECRNGHVHR